MFNPEKIAISIFISCLIVLSSSAIKAQTRPLQKQKKGAIPTDKKISSKTEETEEKKLKQETRVPLSQCGIEYIPGQRLILNEKWEFYREKGRKPIAYSSLPETEKWKKIGMPLFWKESKHLQKYRGRVWYRCGVQLKGRINNNPALFFGSLSGADEVFFNGELIGKTGTIFPPQADTKKQRLYSLPANLWQEGENIIAIRIYGFDDNSGFSTAPTIVNEYEKYQTLLYSNLVPILVASLLMLAALYFGFIALLLRNQKENYFFALYLTTLGFFYLLQTELRYNFFNSFAMSRTVELLMLTLAPVFFLNFLLNWMDIKISIIGWVLQGFFLLLAFTAILSRNPREWEMVGNAQILGLFFITLFTIFILIKNFHANQKKSLFLMGGMLCLIPALANYVLNSFKFIDTPDAIPISLILFMGIIALYNYDFLFTYYSRSEEMEQDINEKEKQKSSAAHNIHTKLAHIFNEMSSSIKHATKPGYKSSDNKKNAKYKFEKSLDRLSVLVSDMNLLNLLESGDYATRKSRFNINELIRNVISNVEKASGIENGRLVLDIQEEPTEITGDPDLISTAIYHLVENAFLYTRGKVEISIEKEDQKLIFMIRDQGPGISPEKQDSIFNKFARGVPPDSNIPGAGIGLNLVELVANYLNGSLRLDTGGGFFSTFTLLIPLPFGNRAK